MEGKLFIRHCCKIFSV